MAQHIILIIWALMASVGSLGILVKIYEYVKIQRAIDKRAGKRLTPWIIFILMSVIALAWLGAVWWAVLTV